MATATVEFQPNRCATGGDKTTFDALITLGQQWVWGIEVKYFDGLTVQQIEREVESIRSLAMKLSFANCGVLFLAPEQQLSTIVNKRGELFRCLSRLVGGVAPSTRLASWEIIFDILHHTGDPALQDQLNAYCQLRNENGHYPIKVSIRPVIPGADGWRRVLMGETSPPTDLPSPSATNTSFAKFGQSSSTLAEVFEPRRRNLAQQIIERSRMETKAQKTGYVNLSRRERAHAQLHSHSEGVALAIRDADANVPVCTGLKRVALDTLEGYKGTNRGWLDGERMTKLPAIAFLIPYDLADDMNHPAWTEVNSLLDYARNK